MSKDLFFSIIVPTLNEEDYLPKILSDLAKQKKKNFEVIIVDAKSTDKTKGYALKFSKIFPLEFCVVEKKNVSHQRNFGALKSGGKYLIFLDADARVDSNFTKNLFEHIQKSKKKLFLPVLIADENTSKNRLIFRVVNSTIKLSQSLRKPLSAGGSVFIAADLFSALNGFREDLYTSEDHNLIQRARKAGIKAKILGDIKVVFSLRRVKKEGEAAILYKYILSSIYMLINGEIKDEIFTYEMGGGSKYKNLKLKEKKTFKSETARLHRFFKKTSTFLTDSLS